MYDTYASAKGVISKPQKLQCVEFLNAIGLRGQEINNLFKYTEYERDKLQPMVKKFESYCCRRSNETVERYYFRKIVQNKRPFDDFLDELQSKAENCRYGRLENSQIRDQIVFGVDSDSLREMLLNETPLSMDKAITMCKEAERFKELNSETVSLASTSMSVGIQASSASGKLASSSSSRKVRFSQHAKPGSPSLSKLSTTEVKKVRKQNGPSCPNCGGRQHRDTTRCPALGVKCYHCRKRNHFARLCPNKP